MSDRDAFSNEPVLELRRPEVRASVEAQARANTQAAPLRVPVLLGESERFAEELVSYDPGDPQRVVAIAAAATSDETQEAVERARRAERTWAAEPAEVRALALRRAAQWLRQRRLEVAALEVRECAKPWGEADADVCEAIDYLEYYSRRALALERGGEVDQVPGEHNELHYAARGVTAVIAPWNFPVAIPMGMTSAAVVTGNAAILKPAEQSPGCGSIVVQALRAGGVPDDIVQLLPGEGSVGAALVDHRDVSTIAFTGSRDVGLEITRRATEASANQWDIKRVIAELGGKNCIIVAADADLDETVPAIVSSAFSYAGQKCSAASRLIVASPIAAHLIERLSGAIEALVVGQANDLRSDVPPVIEQSAVERLDRFAAMARTSGEVLASVRHIPASGYFVAPTLVGALPADSPILTQEIFGPLLSVETFDELDDALERVDALSYALTAGFFSRDPALVPKVATGVPAGNLYINRATTGAMVGRQPFGGNRLSGNGTKAGGPDYLRFFTNPKVVSENTTRHGLVL